MNHRILLVSVAGGGDRMGSGLVAGYCSIPAKAIGGMVETPRRGGGEIG